MPLTEQGDLFGGESHGFPALGLDNELYRQGVRKIVGVDEAGRGPLAGPVTAAAACLLSTFACPGLHDSKKLHARARDRIFDQLQRQRGEDLFFGVGFASSDEIDQMGILPANFLAMRRALQDLGLPNGEDLADFCLVVDGRDRIPDLPGITQIPVIRADSRSPSVAAASVLAKVSRDREMATWAQRYPQYGFERHKGYGTKAHLQALDELGPCPIHRQSFAPVRRSLRNPALRSPPSR